MCKYVFLPVCLPPPTSANHLPFAKDMTPQTLTPLISTQQRPAARPPQTLSSTLLCVCVCVSFGPVESPPLVLAPSSDRDVKGA